MKFSLLLQRCIILFWILLPSISLAAELTLDELMIVTNGQETTVRLLSKDVNHISNTTSEPARKTRFSIVVGDKSSNNFREIGGFFLNSLSLIEFKNNELNGRLFTDGNRVWSILETSRMGHFGFTEAKIDAPSNPIFNSDTYNEEEITKLIAEGKRNKYYMMQSNLPFFRNYFYEGNGFLNIQYKNGKLHFSCKSETQGVADLDFFYDPDKRVWGGPTAETAQQRLEEYKAEIQKARESVDRANAEEAKKGTPTNQPPVERRWVL